MHRVPNVATLACIFILGACAPEDGSDDLVEVKEFSALEIPISIDKRKSITLTFQADSSFEAKVTQSGSSLAKGQMKLYVKDGDNDPVATSSESTKPELKHAVDEPTVFELEIENLDSRKTLSGTLTIGEGASSCTDSSYPSWLGTYAGKLEASGSPLSAGDKTVLDQLLQAKPCNSDDEAFATWIDVFKGGLTEVGSTIDDDDDDYLEYYVEAKNEASGSDPWIAWFSWWAAELEDAGSVLTDDEQSRIAWIGQGAPAKPGNDAYLVYLTELDTVVDDFGLSISDGESARLALLQGVAPEGDSNAAYLAWLGVYERRLDDAGSDVSDDESTLLDIVVDIKACPRTPSDAANQAYWAFLAEADSAVSDWANKADPACTDAGE